MPTRSIGEGERIERRGRLGCHGSLWFRQKHTAGPVASGLPPPGLARSVAAAVTSLSVRLAGLGGVCFLYIPPRSAPPFFDASSGAKYGWWATHVLILAAVGEEPERLASSLRVLKSVSGHRQFPFIAEADDPLENHREGSACVLQVLRPCAASLASSSWTCCAG